MERTHSNRNVVQLRCNQEGGEGRAQATSSDKCQTHIQREREREREGGGEREGGRERGRERGREGERDFQK